MSSPTSTTYCSSSGSQSGSDPDETIYWDAVSTSGTSSSDSESDPDPDTANHYKSCRRPSESPTRTHDPAEQVFHEKINLDDSQISHPDPSLKQSLVHPPQPLCCYHIIPGWGSRDPCYHQKSGKHKVTLQTLQQQHNSLILPKSKDASTSTSTCLSGPSQVTTRTVSAPNQNNQSTSGVNSASKTLSQRKWDQATIRFETSHCFLSAITNTTPSVPSPSSKRKKTISTKVSYRLPFYPQEIADIDLLDNGDDDGGERLGPQMENKWIQSN